jgi:DNA mismatch repair protein MutL
MVRNMTIKMLTPEVISLIAAGEVIERPASVIKELIENSLDAGATTIIVEIEAGGLVLMRVTDNGCGIRADEAELAFERHATSKINAEADLTALNTLGFRGEALASIAAVAEVEMLTRSRDEDGIFVRLENGTIVQKRAFTRSPGTTITVKQLFRKIPARLKFLKSTPTETSHIANVVSQYALGFTGTGFTLLIDGRKTLRTPGNGKLLDSLIEIYGIETAASMLEINGAESVWNAGKVSSVKVSGMVCKPSVNRSGKGYLSFFVNKRWVNSRLLTFAVEEAYHGLLMQGRHPVAVIDLEISPEYIDANVHPSKIEVKFADEHIVFSAVQRAVRRTLLESAAAPLIEEKGTSYSAFPSSSLEDQPFLSETRNTGKAAPAEQMQHCLQPLSFLRLLGQAAGSYIIAEGEDGIYIIDQHATHERIRFEEVKAQLSRNALDIQGLLEPATLEVSSAQAPAFHHRYNELINFGFTVEPFGEKTYLVRTVPAVLYDRDWRTVLNEIIESLSENESAVWQEKICASIACHSAVRAGQSLSDVEMRELIKRVEEPGMPKTCPHGRPVMIHLTVSQMEKEFGRTG